MRSVIIGAAAVVAVTCVGARADEGFEAFRQMCMATRADPAQALAAGDKAGWMPIPKMMLDQFPKSEFQDPKGRLRTTDDAFLMLILAHGQPMFSPDVDVQICAIARMPGQQGMFDKDAAELAAVDSDQIADGKTAYIWRDENGKHIKVDHDSRRIKDWVAKGTLNFLVSQSEDKISMVMLAVPTPATAPAKP